MWFVRHNKIVWWVLQSLKNITTISWKIQVKYTGCKILYSYLWKYISILNKMHLCKKQNESRLQMVAVTYLPKGTCPVPLMGSLHSGNWGGGTAHRPGTWGNTQPQVAARCPWSKEMWPRTAHLCPHLKIETLPSPASTKKIHGQVTAAQSCWKIISHPTSYCPTVRVFSTHDIRSFLYPRYVSLFIQAFKCQQHCGFLHSCRHRKLMLRHLFL